MAFHCNSCQGILSKLDDLANLPLFCPFCGYRIRYHNTNELSAPEHGDEAKPQQEAPRYRPLKHLGRGGTADVYEALDVITGDRVAIKVLLPEFAENPNIAENFRNAGRLAFLLDLPRCVKVLCISDDNGQPFIAMELMPGRTLKELVEEEGPLPAERAAALILDVIEALEAAHAKDVLHRDVKPSNCMLAEDGRVKLGDFGLSARSGETSAEAPLGTVLFASPEQLRGEAIGAASDIYSVSATLYYLLSGRAPHEATSLTAALAKAMTEPPPSLRSLGITIAPSFERIVLKGLERDPARRWQKMADLAEALRSPVTPRSSAMGRWFQKLLGN